MSGLAVLDLPASKLPCLHEGETSQAQLRQLEIHCLNYFTLKGVEKEKFVANAMGCFRDYRITDWLNIDAERTAALLLDFKAFMNLVRERLLPSDWERQLRQQFNTRKQGPKETFMTFATAVRSSNSLLINTASHVDDARIRVILESNMLSDLADDLADDGKAAAEADFGKWLTEVKRVDEKRTRNEKRMVAVAAEERSKRERNATNNGDDRPYKRKRDENVPPSSTSTSGTSTTGKRCPKLQEVERDLLVANHGCTKCRVPFVTH
ncbi:hypothetical protein C8R47DRAFT_971704, partial [Mycena vitilis]